MEIYLPKRGLQILNRAFFVKILCFDFKKTVFKIKNSIFQPKYVRYEKSVKMQNRLLKLSPIVSFKDVWKIINYFNHVIY